MKFGVWTWLTMILYPKASNGVKYLLFRQDLFDGAVETKETKPIVSKETVRASLTMITKKKSTQKIGLTKEHNMLQSLKNYAKLKQYKFTLQGVRLRLHLLNVQYDTWKKILYRYMEDNGYKSIHKMTQYVTTLNSRRNCLVDLIPKNVNNSDFCPFCTANH